MIGLLLAVFPAQAWDNGTFLRTGDVFCTDQTRSDTGVRFLGHVTNGSATASIRTSTSAGGAETVVWTQSAANIDFNKYFYGPAGTFYRGCVTVTAHTINTWGRSMILGLGAGSISDIGPHTATLAPGSRACGDDGEGAVRLVGTAPAGVTWYVTASDLDYAFVGTVFSTTGSSVDTVFVAGPDLTLLKMCVYNSSAQTLTASYELSLAG